MAVRPRAGGVAVSLQANPLLLTWRVQEAPSTYTGVGAREGVEFTDSAAEMPRQPLLVQNLRPQLGPWAQKWDRRGRPAFRGLGVIRGRIDPFSTRFVASVPRFRRRKWRHCLLSPGIDPAKEGVGEGGTSARGLASGPHAGTNWRLKRAVCGIHTPRRTSLIDPRSCKSRNGRGGRQRWGKAPLGARLTGCGRHFKFI